MPEINDTPIDLRTLVVDIRDEPLGSEGGKPREAANAVCDRVLRKAGANLPAAYFQSAI